MPLIHLEIAVTQCRSVRAALICLAVVATLIAMPRDAAAQAASKKGTADTRSLTCSMGTASRVSDG